MAKIIYQGVTYDSQEELDLFHWCNEAEKAGLIHSHQKCEKGPGTFELIEKQHYYVEGKKKHCFASVTYTPDRIIHSDGFIPFAEKYMEDYKHHVDVKGAFSKHNDKKQFQIIRKMMFKIHGIYIHKVVPCELFQKSWVPELSRYTPVKGDVQKRYRNTPTIKEYLNARQAKR